MRDVVICDIDGTLADCSHRRHFVERPNGEKDWKLFFDAKYVLKDTVIEPVKRMVLALHRDYEIIYLTGRDSECFDMTREWLRKNDLWLHPFKLITRPTGDKRPDEVFKREVLHELRANNVNVFLAIDDRQKVVDMWRSEGLICAQVAPGDF